MLKARWTMPRWKNALVMIRHHSPRRPAKPLMRFCSPSGPTLPPNRPPPRVAPLLSTASIPNRPTQMRDDRVGDPAGCRSAYAPRARLNWRRAAKSWPVSLSSQAIRFAIAPRSAGGARRSASR